MPEGSFASRRHVPSEPGSVAGPGRFRPGEHAKPRQRGQNAPADPEAGHLSDEARPGDADLDDRAGRERAPEEGPEVGPAAARSDPLGLEGTALALAALAEHGDA